jgi:hypothetical protein
LGAENRPADRRVLTVRGRSVSQPVSPSVEPKRLPDAYVLIPGQELAPINAQVKIAAALRQRSQRMRRKIRELMKMKKVLTLSVAIALALAASPGFAAGKKTGFASDSGQGNLSNDNSANEPNTGTTEITGPYGQVKQGKTANTTIDLPGRNR